MIGRNWLKERDSSNPVPSPNPSWVEIRDKYIINIRGVFFQAPLSMNIKIGLTEFTSRAHTANTATQPKPFLRPGTATRHTMHFFKNNIKLLFISRSSTRLKKITFVTRSVSRGPIGQAWSDPPAMG
jgi:hypothetical protein